MNIEKNEILNFHFNDGTPIWPLVRFFTLSKIYGSINQSKKILQDSVSKRKNLINKFLFIGNLVSGILHCRLSKKPIQIITTARFNIKTPDGYRNQVDDYYYDVFPDKTFIYERSEIRSGRHRFPRVNKHVSTMFSFIEFLVSLYSYFFKRSTYKDFSQFTEYIKKLDIDPSVISEVNKEVNYLNQRIKAYRGLFSLFLKVTKPKLLLVNCASYGGIFAILLDEAHKLNIKTAEIQHGMITSSQPAYNFSEDIVENDIIEKYLPQTILTFGEYWHKVANSPCKMVAVGSPHLNIACGNINTNFKKNHFLFLSQHTVTDCLINLAIELRKNLKECTIEFRKHPAENLSAKEGELLRNEIIVSGNETDIYEAFGNAEYVVGCYSNGLIEAYALKKKIFILKHPLAEGTGVYDVGTVVTSGKEISSKIKAGFPEIKKEFWATDFEKRYKTYIKSIINI